MLKYSMGFSGNGKPRKASEADYIKLQGGMPSVENRDGLTVVIHNYEAGQGMEVASHIDHGTIIFNIDGNPVEFKVDLVRSLHGQPCETESRRNGGDGYPRRRI